MLAAALAGCASPDACDGIVGTCASLDVYGNGVGEIDQLRITVNGQTKSTAMSRHSLPVQIAAAFPPSIAGTQTVDVIGMLNGNPVGEGSAPVLLRAGVHARATVTLSPHSFTDGGAPLDAADAAPSGCKTHADCATKICQPGGQCAAQTDVIYVDNVNGTCTGPHLGNQTDPFCQVPASINKPFVHLESSKTAYGAVSLQSISVSFVGPGMQVRPSAIIAGGTAPSFSIGTNVIATVDGLELTSTTKDAVACTTTSNPSASTVTITNSYIHGVGQYGLDFNGCDLVLDRDQIGPSCSLGALYFQSGNYSITNCFIVGNGPQNIAMEFRGSMTTGVFRHNTVADNVNSVNGSAIACAAGGVLEDSIIWMNTKDSATGSQVHGTAACALVNVDIDETATGTGNRNIAPEFVNRGTDYHLNGRTAANLACCVDQIASSPVDHDVDGRARPVNGKWDIGAHEVP